jgi:hypothetical protein
MDIFMHWFFLQSFCMLVVTGLLAGACVHQLDVAHGSVKLASPRRAGGWSEVWLPACRWGGAANGTQQQRNDARGWGGGGVMRHTLARSVSEEGTQHCSSISTWGYTVSAWAQRGASPTNKPKCIVASPVYFAASCTPQQGIPSSSSLSFLIGG